MIESERGHHLRFCPLRAEVCGYTGGTEAIIKNRLDNSGITFNVVVDGKREMRYAHTMMSEMDRMDPCKVGEIVKCLADGFHEMVKHPCAAGRIEILRFNKVELCQSRKADALHFTRRFFWLRGGLSLRPSHRRESFRRHRDAHAVPIPSRAMPAAYRRLTRLRETTRDNPSSGSSRRSPFHQLLSARLAYSLFLFLLCIIPHFFKGESDE